MGRWRLVKLHSQPSGHYYSEKNALYPSVTTILGSVENPGLEAWKRNTKNWRQISGAACSLGTAIHKEIEYVVMGKRIVVKHKMQVELFLEWQREMKFRCIKTELKVRSVKGFAGSLDLLGYIGDKLFIVDLKTSARVYPEMLLQLAAYRYAFQEMNSLLNLSIGVLRIDKKVELVEWHLYSEEEYEVGIAEFLELCTSWHKEHNTKIEFAKKFILEE